MRSSQYVISTCEDVGHLSCRNLKQESRNFSTFANSNREQTYIVKKLKDPSF